MCLTQVDREAETELNRQLDGIVDELKDAHERRKIGVSYGLGRAAYDKVVVPDLLRSQRRFPAVGAKDMTKNQIYALMTVLGGRAGQRLLAVHPNSKLTQDWLRSE